MSLSLEKLFSQHSDNQGIDHILLFENEVQLKDGAKLNEDLERLWPSFSFLKGMGFERIEFHDADPQSILHWAERIQAYEQDYLQDPDYLDIDACVWNEISVETDKTLIACFRRELKHNTSSALVFSVPPLKAPLAVDERAISAFVDEAKHQSTEDTILRMQSILLEFKDGKEELDHQPWLRLVADVICVTLENSLLRKAVSLSEEHKEVLAQLWNDEQRAHRIFSAYEPKAPELELWSKIFSSLSNEKLVLLLKNSLSTSAGPQVLKLMHVRVQHDPEDFIEICLEKESSLQKLILQWLTPYWQPRHYRKLLNALKLSLEKQDDFELIHSWIQALLKSYQSQAFEDLKLFFKPQTWIGRVLKTNQKSKESGIQSQRFIVKALAEHPSAETVRFLREVKPFIHGGVADNVEKVISSYGMRGSK